MKPGQTLRCVLAFVLAVVAGSRARGADDVHLVFTADTQGHVGPCQSCPGAPGLGSLARRATFVASLRQRQPSMLLLDAGNALFGDESLSSHGKVIVAAYDAIGYDAINVSYRDFREGKDATLAALKGAKAAAISANLLDAATNQPLLTPYVVKEIAGRKLAIVGATEAPVALDLLPHLKQELTGITVRPPADALAAVLPKVRAEAQGVVLLYYGSPASLGVIRQRFANQIDVILVGGARPAELPQAGGAPPMFATGMHGREAGDVLLASGRAPAVTQWAIVPALKPDPRVQKLVTEYVKDSGPLTFAPPAGSPALASAATGPLTKIEPGKIERINLSARNRAAELRITSVSLLDKLGDAKAPAGKRLLVLDAQLRNLQPAQKVDGKWVPVQYVVPKLSDHLYAVADGARVLERPKLDAAGMLPFDQISLVHQNDTIEGKLAYAVPAGTLAGDVTLRFYDFAHGNMVLPLVSAGPERIEIPIVPAQHNSVVEAGIYSVRKLPVLGNQRAPAGMTFVAFDLRGRSTVSTSADASAFDPNAAKGSKIDVGTVADWKESRKYAQVVVDGEYGYLPLPQSELAPEPRFLPDVFTGGTLAFLVPQKVQSLELRCDFPNARLPDGSVQRPQALTFAIEGTRPPPRALPAIASAKDDVFDVSVVGQQAASEFAGTRASGNQKFLVLNVSVKNNGSQQEFFQTRDQLKYVTEAGQQIVFDRASLLGVHPPSDLVYVPPGERRSFDLAYRIPASDSRPRLSYAAVSEGASKVADLNPIDRARAPAAVAQTPAPAAVAQTPAPQAVAVAPQPAPPVRPAPAPQPPATPREPVQVALTNAKENPLTARPRPHGPARGIEGVGLTAEQVNAAIDRGAAGLWQLIQKEDLKGNLTRFGDSREHVLCALALVHADAHKKFPLFNTALRGYLSRVDPRTLGGYQNGLLCMLIEAYGDPAFDPKLRESARYLVEAQGAEGTWNYNANVPEALFAPPVQAGALQVTGGTPPGQRGEEFKRLTDWKVGSDGDNSVSQFAVLGLQAASRAGINIWGETWKRMLAQTLKRRCDDGGWAYHDRERDSYGSMTSAGICAVAICRNELGEPNPADDPAIQSGLAWLDKNFTVDKHPGHSPETQYVYYFLYSLERVGRILNTEFIGANEWYPLGAAKLVGAQHADGLWTGAGEEQEPRIATSFALMFLERATPPLRLADRKGPGTLRTGVMASASRYYFILDCSGSMIDDMEGKLKFDIARGAVQGIIDDLPPDSEVALRVYGHRKNAIQPGADLDTQLIIPMGKLDRNKCSQVLQGLRAHGKTPLALSLEQTIQDLGQVDAGSPVTVVLLTDGGEDTFRPRGNPLKAADDFGKVKNVRFHIVGFDINQPAWSQQLEAMARRAHARYWPAAHSVDLQRSIRSAVLGVPEQYVILDKSGKEVAHGQFGDAQTLPQGQYKFQTVFAGQTFSEDFWISPQSTTAITFDATKAPAGAVGGAAAQPPTVQPTAVQQQPAVPADYPKFCTHCGAPLKPGQKYCTHCGAKVGS